MAAEEKNRKNPWDGIVPEQIQENYRLAGFGARARPGRRPALLVIDVQYHAVGETPRPLPEALAEHPMNCGEAGWEAVPHIARMIAAFRERGFPVIYPYVAPRAERDHAKFGRMPSFVGTGGRGYEIVEAIAPHDEDILLPKYYPSAFFGTALSSRLNGLSVDTLVLTGCTTSGCIRATAVDAYSLNYKVMIPHECVFDRSPISHAVNLFDMASKYAEVMTTEQAIETIASMPR